MARFAVFEIEKPPTDWREVREAAKILSASIYNRDADHGHSGVTYAMAASVHGGLILQIGGYTPMLGPDVASRLMATMDVQNPDGLRDRDVTAVYRQAPNHCGGSLTKQIVAIEV